MRHAHRTAGFFKIRGINMNHAEFEDFVFRMPEVNDFRVELVTESDREMLRLMIEVKRGARGRAAIAKKVAEQVRQTFEVRPDVEVLPIGTLAKQFEVERQGAALPRQAHLGARVTTPARPNHREP